jgi:RNA-binding protein Nova
MDGLGFIMPELDAALRSKRTSSRIVIDEISPSDALLSDKKLRAGASSNLSLKFLISNNSAGYLIGKSGATISELQASTKARINISQAGEFFPGTLDRAVLLVGSVPSLIGCQSMIWNRLSPSLPVEEGEASIDGIPIVTGKLLIPSSISGLIIGRGGSTIQLIAEMSGAKLKLSAKVMTLLSDFAFIFLVYTQAEQ